MRVHFHLLAVGLISLACAGCLRIPYCLPELDHVSAVETKSSSSDVKAVRADVETATELIHGPCFGFLGAKKKELWRLTPVEASVDGVVPGQWVLGWETGRRYIGFWNYRDEWTSHAVTLRLYRPGFETIVLASRDDALDLKWKQIVSLADRENAIDDWLGTSTWVSHLKASWPSPEQHFVAQTRQQRQPILDAIREYETLANEVSSEPQARERLLMKAAELRKIVEGPKEP